jgi:hypothetical protein
VPLLTVYKDCALLSNSLPCSLPPISRRSKMLPLTAASEKASGDLTEKHRSMPQETLARRFFFGRSMPHCEIGRCFYPA